MQSTTYSEFIASRAIDGDPGTVSATDQNDPKGQHWLRVSMDLVTVNQVILKGYTYNHINYTYGVWPITVALYKGGKPTGRCKDHPGTKTNVTLSCEKVEADKVQMSITGTNGYLVVYEVEVIGTVIGAMIILFDHGPGGLITFFYLCVISFLGLFLQNTVAMK